MQTYASPADQPASVIPSVSPGVYAAPQLVSFAKPAQTRLLVGIDGAPLSENSAPIFLSVPEGSVHVFFVETELHSLSPDGGPAVRARFSWTIDRASPSAPSFSEKQVEGGRTVTPGLSEDGTVYWKMYHPLFRASAAGSVSPGESVFVPDGAVLCAWGVDRAGNRGPSAVPEHRQPGTGSFPCRLVSPAPGLWANPQMLVVERGAGVSVSYTTDSSDPEVSGIPYTGPVLLSDIAITTVRIHAVDSSGTTLTDQVRFTVVPSSSSPAGTTPVPDFPANGSLVKTGEFMELRMPQGYTCSTGNAVTPDSAETRLVLTSVRGIRSYFPVTVTDGTSQWRWMCVGGQDRADGTAKNGLAVAPAGTAASADPLISIHDWYFIDIAFPAPVYASLDGGSWQALSAPLFVERSADHTLRWYSGSWKSGEIQSIDLPSIPVIAGLPSNGLTATPVFLTEQGSSYTLQYECGYFAPESPTAFSPELASGLLVEVPKGTESPFTFRFRAVHDGLVHGELDASFIVDRKIPRAPSAGISDALGYSRVPVTLNPAGEDMVQIAITPALFRHEGTSFILEGDPSRSVDYTITLFAVDRAGNKSRVVTRNLTVDLNALYVDTASGTTGARDGTPSAPYISLDNALDAVRGSGSWRIYVKGDTTLSNPHVIRNDIDVIGSGGTVSVGAGGSLTVLRSSLSFHGVPMLRTKTASDTAASLDRLPRASAPFISLDNAHFNLVDSTVRTFDSRSGTLIRARNSVLAITGSKISFSADDYALLLDADHCAIAVQGSSLAVQARDASAIALASSTAVLETSTFSVSAVSACRAVESWDSTLSLRGLSLVRNTLAAPAGSAVRSASGNRDSALWLDRKSRILSESAVTSSGFWRLRDTGTTR